MKFPKQKSLKAQKGFSLIEMMVAMLIGLFLMGGVVSVYVSSAQSSRINNGLRTMQENGRFALTLLRESIQMSGYIPGYDPLDVINPFPAASNDSLTVSYEADLDCTGADTTAFAAPNTGLVRDSFQVNSNKELTCTQLQNNTTQTLIEGVDQIRILYGLDDDDDGAADRYVSASAVSAADWQSNVRSVRIALLMNSVTDIKPVADSKTYTLLDTTATISDRMLHKVFTTTILIRNRMT
ncbi:MAG: PilW family protein [Gammaproteobacteria bacterium]